MTWAAGWRGCCPLGLGLPLNSLRAETPGFGQGPGACVSGAPRAWAAPVPLLLSRSSCPELPWPELLAHHLVFLGEPSGIYQ